MTKFELSISTSYVPTWGVTEAVRELFQNAVDQQTEFSDNKMFWQYTESDEKLLIGNKTSVLTRESLLLGESSKRDNEKTIGQHGEGYKLAFMILLREHKKVKVYNYGAREIWEARLVKSRKYGKDIPTIFVNKQPIWDREPSHNLIIEVTGITPDEYNEIVSKNLHLKYENKEKQGFKAEESFILTAPEESGNMYVAGLFVMHSSEYKYGYDFDPSTVSLDRDRKMIREFDLSYTASKMWRVAAEKYPEALIIVDETIMQNNELLKDMSYIQSLSYYTTSNNICEMVENRYREKYGEDTIPVTTVEEYDKYKSIGVNTALVNKQVYSLVSSTNLFRNHISEIKEEADNDKNLPLKDRFLAFAESIESKLDSEEYDKLLSLIEEMQ